MHDSPDADVLIVGAGPTGLVLALWLAKAGVRFRLIEKNAGPGEASRAMAVQARTLEFYRQLGFAEEVVKRGIKIEALQLREGRDPVAVFDVGDFGEGLSPFPFVLSFPQDDHERLLVERLDAEGIKVEWDTELTGFEETGNRVRASLRKGDGEERCEVAWLCACDGAHSTVRKQMGVDFPGGTYEQMFFVSDVEATGGAVNGALNLCLGADRFCLVLPVRGSGTQRLIGIVPPELRDREEVTFEEIRPFAEELIGITVERLNWFSLYQVHHRVAGAFRSGRVFLAGDAAHIHSPAGGQGMNTGIGDAVNLAWKIAAATKGKGSPALLDTYEPERMAFARSLVATTDRVFTSIVDPGIRGRLLRELVIPNLMPFLLGFKRLRKGAFRTLSQARIHYPESELSEGDTGEIEGGDRLPWVEAAGNFDPLGSLDWQLHVYGEASGEIRGLSEDRNLALHEFAWSEAAEAADLAEDAIYLVRPDGYIAFAGKGGEVGELADFLDRFAISPRPRRDHLSPR